jgi:hypothetical protein
MSAPAEAVICFLIHEGSSESLATEHLSDVGTRFTGNVMFRVFALGHVSCSIRLATRRPLLFPTSQCRPSMGLPYGWLATHPAWRTDGVSTFHVIALTDNLGGTWTPMARRSRAGTLETCNLAMHANTGKHAFDLVAPVDLNAVDDACGPLTLLTILSNPSP